MSRPVLVARDAHAEPVRVTGRVGPLVIDMGPAGSLDLDVYSAISLRDAIDRALRLAATQQHRPVPAEPAAVEDPLEFTGQPAGDGYYRWTLRGRHGGIDFEVRQDGDGSVFAGPIMLHSPVERDDFAPQVQDQCSLLGGRCFSDAGYAAGKELATRWAADRSTNPRAVIRAELESWYRIRLATPDGEVDR